MLKIKGAVSRRLREDDSHLLSQIYNDITETMWNIIWYHIYIVKIASDHYICTFFVSKKNYAYESNFGSSVLAPGLRRKRGRPKTTWRRTGMKELMEMHLTRGEAKEQERVDWRHLIAEWRGWASEIDRKNKLFHASFHCKNYFGQFSSSNFVLINFEKLPTWTPGGSPGLESRVCDFAITVIITCGGKEVWEMRNVQDNMARVLPFTPVGKDNKAGVNWTMLKQL